MAGKYDKRGSKNPKWRGGVSSMKTADELLTLSSERIEAIKKRILELSVNDSLTGCREWIGSTFNKRYGRYSIGKHGMLAHKVAFVTGSGTATNGLCVCHTCDNLLCVQLDHLFLGTNKDNTADMFRKGRNPPQDCENNGAAKLTNEKVRVIKARLKSGDKRSKIASDYGVVTGTIDLIATGKTWVKI